MSYLHRHGGTITAIAAIEHSTFKGVAYWEFRGRVQWDDGTVSESAHISPACVCHVGTPEMRARVDTLMQQLSDYLTAQGTWHEMKHKRDGRCYSWSPHKPAGSQAVQS